MQHPVMGPAEAERLELMVGIADEIAIAKNSSSMISQRNSPARGGTDAASAPSNRVRQPTSGNLCQSY
jgi:hypothetical protein